MAKKNLKAMVWFGGSAHRDYGGNSVGTVYPYIDFQDVINRFMLGSHWHSFNDREKKAFMEAVEKGEVKIAEVGKNVNGNKDTGRFSDLQDGDYFVNAIMKKDTVYEFIYSMSPTLRNSLSMWGMHCKLDNLRDLNESERETINNVFGKANKFIVSDSVFNSFATMCGTSGDEFWAFNSADNQQSKRTTTTIRLQTVGMFDHKEVEKKEFGCKFISDIAHTLVQQLTGHKLVLKDRPDIGFTYGILASRYCNNDYIDVEKICEPTISMNDLYDVLDGKRDKIGDITREQLSLVIKHRMPMNTFNHLKDLFDKNKTKVIEVNAETTGYKVSPELFENIKQCVVFAPKAGYVGRFWVCLYGDTAATYEILDDLATFLQVMSN